MAHALRLINIVENEEFNFYDKKVMTDFDQEARYEIEKIKGSSDVSSIFREYSVTNNEEFFAGAVELFFEKPSVFKGYNPKLYGMLVNIFKIDPEDVMKTNQYRWTA